MNVNGTPETLVASHPENVNAVVHGVYSRTGRVLEPRAREIADALMSAPPVTVLDELGAIEIARLTALIEAIDAARYVHLLADDLPTPDFFDAPLGNERGTQPAETDRNATRPDVAATAS